MNSTVLIVRLLLAGVFATAAITKLGDLPASRDTVEAFGVSRRYARIGGTALPFLELAVSVGLLPQPSARWAAVAGLALLVVFDAGVAFALSQGRTPDCNCFGQVSSKAIGKHTIARNAVFALFAALIVWKAPGSALTSWTRNTSAANLVSALAVFAVALMSVAVFYYRQRAGSAPAAVAAEDGQATLPLGTMLPAFALPTFDGLTVTRDDLLALGKPLVMIFASPTCGPCRMLMPELGRWHAALNESITFVVIESGVADAASLKPSLGVIDGVTVLIEESYDTAFMLGAHVTPTGLAVDVEGLVASTPVPGQSQIESLVRNVVRARSAEELALAASEPGSSPT